MAGRPEDTAREEIDRQLVAAGWYVCDVDDANIHAHPGLALREFPLKRGHGFADYLLYVNAKAAGVIEAKKVGTSLTGVEIQSDKYKHGLPNELPAWFRPLPFSYQSTGVETRFTNVFDPDARARNVFSFHRPETLAAWLSDEAAGGCGDIGATGRAAIVVPDNVLFEGGAGETIRRNLLNQCEVHTLLRLPTGLFHAQGVKANVLFFDRKPASETPWTKKLWIYDLRTNKHFTLKTGSLKRTDLDEFVECYNPANRHDRKPTWSDDNPDGRWRSFGYEELIQRDKVNLDIFWIRDESLEDSENLPEPDVILQEMIEDLESALEQLRGIAEELTEESTDGRSTG